MKKAVIIPDSFKGTLTSGEVCEIVGETIKKYFPRCEVVKIPFADGGEGSVDCLINAFSGRKEVCIVHGPYLNEIQASYGVIADDTAVIEIAACAGLALVEHRENPMATSTYGVGEMILYAAEKGYKKVLLGLGGSCTNDGGTGMAKALGVHFYDEEGNDFLPVGGTLDKICKIDMSEINDLVKNIEFTAMCDIDNPLYGFNGAAYVFAPQKGADKRETECLDQGLKHLSEAIRMCLDKDVSDIPGAGAAGGMGAGALAFLNAKMKMGTDAILDAVRFEEVLSSADIVFTGEGRLDSQSIRGKVISGVCKRSKIKNIPVIAITGGYETELEEIYNMGLTAVFSINTLPEPFEISRCKSRKNLEITAENIIRILSKNKTDNIL